MNWHLWTVDLQTGSKIQLTPPGHRDAYYPAWSPDGEWIAYTSYYGSRIYKIPAAGGSPVEIIHDPGGANYPSWSPDGKKIAYQSRNNNNVIKIIDIERIESSQLTSDSSSCHYPDWSPDGLTIAYFSHRNDTTAIWTIPVNGGKETKLTKNISFATNPAWSPDGSKIAFRTSQGIWIASAYGDIIRKMHSQTNYPVWWPEGDALIQSQRRKYSIIEIFSLNDSLSSPVTKAVDNQYDQHPTWYTNSDTIAFGRNFGYPN